MIITVKLFAQLRVAAGTGELTLELPPGATAADAARRIKLDHPGLEPAGSMVAVNATYADPGTELREGDVLALLPPVAGG